MNYTKEDLRKFFLAGRRYGLTENEDNTTMSFDKFFDVYSQIQEDTKNSMYDQHKEQWRGWIDMKKIEEMKKRDEDKIKATIKKDSEVAKLIDVMKIEKQEFKKTVESSYNKKQTAVEFIETELVKLNILTDSGTQVSVIRIFEQAKEMEKETEISDEEIAKSMGRYNITDFGQMAAYVTGAKWYREKLKSKQ